MTEGETAVTIGYGHDTKRYVSMLQKYSSVLILREVRINALTNTPAVYCTYKSHPGSQPSRDKPAVWLGLCKTTV